MKNVSLLCREMGVNQRRKELLLKTDRIVDDLYFLKDILCVGESRLSKVVTQKICYAQLASHSRIASFASFKAE
jgi:protein CLEC16A